MPTHLSRGSRKEGLHVSVMDGALSTLHSVTPVELLSQQRWEEQGVQADSPYRRLANDCQAGQTGDRLLVLLKSFAPEAAPLPVWRELT